jgi:transcriptional regulator with XRE-family HTH domain
MSRKKPAPAAALQYLDPSFFERNPKHRAALEEARASAEIAQLVSGLRAGSGLGVKELARAAGLTPKALERLESGANPRLALAQLRQVATALGQRVEVRLVAAGRKARPAPRRGPGGASPQRA